MPGGVFEMGCNANEPSVCNGDEKPVRPVRLETFWLGKFEVTQSEWVQIMGKNPSQKKADRNPVENVSWRDVQLFIGRLNFRSRQIYRLPTEAEWEFACRGVSGTAVYGTSTGHLLETLANFKGKDGVKGVGTFPPNSLGLYDLSGNVWEWVQDAYDADAYRKLGEANPINRDANGYFSTRGGAFGSRPDYLRCTQRFVRPEGFSGANVGFRLARTP